jgi:hypothetical protein
MAMLDPQVGQIVATIDVEHTGLTKPHGLAREALRASKDTKY